MTKSKWFASSVDPNELSLTLKGLLISLVPLVIVLGKYYGVGISEGDIATYIEVIVSVVSGVTILLGLVRKLYASFVY